MKKLLLTVGTALCLCSPAYAAKVPISGTNDSRIKTVAYQADDVYVFHGHYGYGTTIKFDTDEKIESISIGASNSWQIVPNNDRNLVFIKPVEENADTNMTVITDKRFYHFELSAHTPQTPRAKDIIFELQFIYPSESVAEYAYGGLLAGGPDATNIVSYSEAASPEAVASAVASDETIIDNPETLSVQLFDKPQGQAQPDPRANNANTNYSMKGDGEFAPSIIFDDGEFTYVKFYENTEIPSIFAVDKNGNEEILNTFNREGYIVIDHVGRQFTFRRGDLATCIYNRAFNGGNPVFQGGLNG